MFLSKLKIRTRLAIGVILLLSFSVFISLAAIWQMRQSSLRTNLIYEEPFFIINGIRDLNNRIYRIHNICDNFIFLKDKVSRDSVLLQTDCLHKRNIIYFDTLLHLLQNEKSIIKDACASYNRWYDSEIKFVNWLGSVDNNDEVDIKNSVCEANLGELLSLTNHITEIVQQKAFDYYTLSREESKKNTLVFTAVILGLLALSQFLAIIVTRSISSPLKRVTVSLRNALNQNEKNTEKYSEMCELELMENSALELNHAFNALQEEVSRRKIAEEKIEEQYNEIDQKNKQLELFNSDLKQQVDSRTKELSDSEIRYRTLFEEAAEGIVCLDGSGQIIDVNRAYANMHGYTIEEILKRNIKEINTKESTLKHPERMNKILSGESLRFEVDHYHKNGNIITLDVSAYHIKINGKDLIFSFLRDISERKKSEEILRESEERYRTLFENSIEGIFIISLKGQVISVNESFARMHGYTIGEILKMNLSDIDTPESSREIPERMKRIIAGESIIFETEHYHKNGSVVTLDVSACPVRLNNELFVVAFHRDITEQKKISEGLRMLKQAVETSAEAIFMTDRKGVFTYVNPQFTNLYGYTSGEVVNLKTPRILKSGKLGTIAYEKFWNDLIKGKIKNTELINKTKDGNFLSIESSANAVYDVSNKIIGFLAIQRDITERKRIQEELIRAKEKAEESDRLKSAFLANMSHEIRTPLNGIVGFSEMLARPNVTDAKKVNYLSIIKECSEQLMAIINDLIDIAKIEANQLKISESDVNVDLLFNELQVVLGQKITSPDVKLIYLPDPVKPDTVILTDGNRLKQVMINLIDNAIKFTPSGVIKFGFYIRNYFIEFFVEDSGIGIEPDKQTIIFEPFRQAESGLSRNFGGTGLGLSISRALVKLLGGNIWLHSEPGKGSVFSFNIPLKICLENTPPDQNLNKRIPEYFNFNGKTVLVAEDEMLSFHFLDELLSDMGIKAIHAKNGKEAVEMACTMPEINLILMDIKMPLLTGYEAIMKIKNQRPELPIIVQTAYAQSGDREKAVEAGCDEYISKPLKVEDLNYLLGKFLLQ